MRDIIINLKKTGTRKIQLAIAINFVSSKDVDEESVIHSKSSKIIQMKLLINFQVTSFKISNWFRKINEMDWFYFCSTFVSWMSQDKF